MKRYRLSVKIVGRDASRVFEVDGSTDLDDLEKYVLASFDFDYDHLYEFRLESRKKGRRTYAKVPYFEDDMEAEGTVLDDLTLRKNYWFVLIYDYGPEWTFFFRVEKTTPATELKDPEVVSAEGCVEQYPETDDILADIFGTS